MYSAIYDFCKVRNKGTIFENNFQEPTPRVKFLMELLDSLGVEYELDKFLTADVTGYNIILPGTSNKVVVAHHDVNNSAIDNANDNSCSVINAIATKLLMPSTKVVLLDGEEFGGIGAQRASTLIREGELGQVSWVLNLELTGRGGKKFFVGDYPGRLTTQIVDQFGCPVVRTPFNDSVIFRKNGIDSTVINPLPALPEGKTSRVKYNDEYLDFSILFNCHKPVDSVDSISTEDMQEFVEEVVIKILS